VAASKHSVVGSILSNNHSRPSPAIALQIFGYFMDSVDDLPANPSTHGGTRSLSRSCFEERQPQPITMKAPFIPACFAPTRPRQRLPRQWFEQVGAASRKGREWRATPTFVSIRRFDPTPSFCTTEPGCPSQPNRIPLCLWVFVRLVRVVAVARPQNRTVAPSSSTVQGVDMAGRKSRLAGWQDRRKALHSNVLRRMAAGFSAGIGPDRGENSPENDAAGRLG